MRVTQAVAGRHREEIVHAAGTLFRERGFDGVGISDIMQAAGFTHGGFYKHFASKDDLSAEASAAALAASASTWAGIAGGATGNPLEALVDHYLSPRHYAQRGTGCAFAALAADAPRKSRTVRQAFGEGLKPFIAILTDVVTGRTRSAKRKKALAVMSQLVGAVMLARMVDDADFAREILDAASHDILAG
jgi:TetR/AcrR family transcriptional repressor of nem operon